MSDINITDDIYVQLAQNAYVDTPVSFAISKLNRDQRMSINVGQSVQFNLEPSSQVNLDISKSTFVYLQPDPTLKTITYSSQISDADLPNGSRSFQKGLLTDEPQGFNAYFLTDTPTLDATTKDTYLTIHGTDGVSFASINDWVGNNLPFGIEDAHIPQAKLATAAMEGKIDDIRENAPEAMLNITGHSLGKIDGLANLPSADSDKVKSAVFFNGPDVTKSLKKMGLTAAQIKEAGSKVVYYLNPFDVVAMLNLETPFVEQFGRVEIAVPLNFTATFDTPSSHDMSQFQVGADGQVLVATAEYHPYLITAAKKHILTLDF